MFERYKFCECKLPEDESIDRFITELRTRAKSCEFGDQQDSLIRDRIVLGVSDIRPNYKERLLRESSDRTLEKAANQYKTMEGSGDKFPCACNKTKEQIKRQKHCVHRRHFKNEAFSAMLSSLWKTFSHVQ